ncbi:MAG: nitrite reductase, copper-containing, partial [Anaerolineales bacterium]
PEVTPWIPTATPQEVVDAAMPAAADDHSEDLGVPDVRYTLLTGGGTGKLIFVGVGGDIDGLENPTLTAEPGDVVEITLINGDKIEHDLLIEELGVHSEPLQELDAQSTVTFKVEEEAEYAYFCSIPGHRQAGMVGTLRVGQPQSAAATAPSIVRNPADLPAPVGDRPPQTIAVDLLAQELEGQLADGTTYSYYTFNGQVPGPMIRVRVGDTVELTLTNATASSLSHSIDLHAVNGPGGGAVYTQTAPGDTHAFSFKALNPGVYVYHCATPSVPHHIASGMYGLIVVEPEGGLPLVDKEFYVMQGEIYTEQAFGTLGHLDFSMQKLLNETPEYFVFNGAAGALTSDENALRAEVGDTVRIFVGVGGPNFTSSFHVIGEIFDRVYPFGSMTSPALTDVQTISVAPGGAWIVEFKLEVPGRYILVDHALSRLERGLAGFLYAEGEDAPEIFAELTPGT